MFIRQQVQVKEAIPLLRRSFHAAVEETAIGRPDGAACRRSRWRQRYVVRPAHKRAAGSAACAVHAPSRQLWWVGSGRRTFSCRVQRQRLMMPRHASRGDAPAVLPVNQLRGSGARCRKWSLFCADMCRLARMPPPYHYACGRVVCAVRNQTAGCENVA